MADIIPFRGVRFNADRVRAEDVVAPPYDIISPEMREVLYARSPFNIVRIDFGMDLPGDDALNNRHTRAKAHLEQWLREGVLISDPIESLYVYEIKYRHEGESRCLRGVVCLVKIEELGAMIFPHEETHSKPKADRLELMRSCEANISPIYSLYRSPDKVASRIIEGSCRRPLVEACDTDGAVHKLFAVSEPSLVSQIAEDLRNRDLFIADGHHRYEVSLEYKRQMDAALGVHSSPSGDSRPWDYVMMFLANMADEGITILPTHRLVKGLVPGTDIPAKLRSDFMISPVDDSSALASALREGGRNSFGLFDGRTGRFYILRYRGTELRDLPPAVRELDVVILHELILKRDLAAEEISYEMAIDEAIGKVRSGNYQAAFFLNPTSVRDIERVAASRLRMPPKSTYFYPKLLTGMVINSHKFFKGGFHGS